MSQSSGAPSRWPLARRPWASYDPWISGLVVAFAAVRVLGAVWTGSTSYPDSPTYRVSRTWLDFSLTSLTGDSVRPWGVTAWMALWPGDEGIVLAQSVLSIVAWTWFALTASAHIRHRLVRRLLVAALLLIGCTAQVTNWDHSVLGESVSLSTGVLALTALLQLLRRPRPLTAVALVVLSLWFVLTRPNLFPVLIAWGVALLVIARARGRDGSGQGRRLGIIRSTAAVLIVVSAYSYVYNLRADPAWTATLGYSRSTVAYAYPVGRFDPVAPQVIKDLRRSDAPACMIPDGPGEVTHSGTTAWVLKTVHTCPGMNAWATSHWNAWWSHWLLTHPGSTATIVDYVLPSSLSPPVWTPVMAATPVPVADAFFGSSTLPQPSIPGRTVGAQPLVLWVALAAILGVLGRRSRRGRALAVALAATLVGALGSAISSALLIQTVPIEVGQESLAACMLMTVGAVLLVAVGIDRRIDGVRTTAGC